MDQSISPAELQKMPASLVGDGEWAAAGLPSSTNPNRIGGALAPGVAAAPVAMQNKLTGIQTNPVQVGNMLTRQPAPAPGATPPLSVGPAPQPVPVASVPPGQERHAAVGRALAVDKMSDAELKQHSGRYEWVRNALGAALQRPDLSHDDLVQTVADGVREKVIPAGHAAEILGSLPANSADLRDALQQRQLIAAHGLVHMAMEQNRRAVST